MDLFNLFSKEGPIFALFGVLTTVIINWLIQKSKGRVDILTSERQTLSEDQQNFRSSIIDQLNLCRKTVDTLTEENHNLHLKCLEEQEKRLILVEEVIVLKQKILRSSQEIQDLMKKLEELNDKKAEVETRDETSKD